MSGCDSKPPDGTMIATEAKPLTDEQKAEHRKFYPERTKKTGKRGAK
jgi:hypothetical protein